MTEAVGAMVAYCFDELAIHRIEALIHPDNVASIRLVERLGFRCEGGPLRDRWRRGEDYMSVMMYALIARRPSLSPFILHDGERRSGVEGQKLAPAFVAAPHPSPLSP